MDIKTKTHKKKIRVAVLMGGPSLEHEVSLKSGENVLKNLDKEKYESFRVLIDKNGTWSISPFDLKNKCDVVFIALHGTYGEDGGVQSLLEEIGLIYTGSDALTSALAMNKFLTLKILKARGLIVPLSNLVSKIRWLNEKDLVYQEVFYYFGLPVVVKPNDNGSSVGVFFVEDKKELENALEKVFQISKEALIQELIKGREVTCGVLDFGWVDSAYPLVPTEIIPKKKFFDYEAKYHIHLAEEITPARFAESFNREIQKVALTAHKILNCKGMSRTDMIVGRDKKIYVLETNTIPGLTERSLLPQQAQAMGISFSELLDRIIAAALIRSYNY